MVFLLGYRLPLKKKKKIKNRKKKRKKTGDAVSKNWEEIWGSEWIYVKRLGAAISDPHDKKEFWENIKSRKLADSSFSIYALFPRSESTTHRAREECFEFVRGLRKPKEEESA